MHLSLQNRDSKTNCGPHLDVRASPSKERLRFDEGPSESFRQTVEYVQEPAKEIISYEGRRVSREDSVEEDLHAVCVIIDVASPGA